MGQSTYFKKISFHIKRKKNETMKGGVTSLFQNIGKSVICVFLLPIVLVVRILRPFVLIRFGQLTSDRIGHYALDTEFYLCKRDLHKHRERTVDLFFDAGIVCNYQLKKMWHRKLHVCRLNKYLYICNYLLPGSEKHTITLKSERALYALLPKTSSHLSFSKREEQIGIQALQYLGVSHGSPFICFHVRDSAYLSRLFCKSDWSYHDYRDANINDCLQAAEELARRGYYLIRMGAVVKDKLEMSNPMIIDYAINGKRTDFLDIYLGAKCRFFVCSTGGIYAVPTIFRRPVAYVNFVPLEYVPRWTPLDLFIPKKFWLRAEGRLMTFREVIESGAGSFLETQDYKKNGIEVVNNTPEEIRSLVTEMDDRLNGKWREESCDEELQNKFWSLFKSTSLPGAIRTRIGAEFLRQNEELVR